MLNKTYTLPTSDIPEVTQTMYGYSLSMSQDGTRVVVAAPASVWSSYSLSQYEPYEKVFIYDYDQDSDEYKTSLILSSPGVKHSWFGSCVKINSKNKDWIAIGAPGRNNQDGKVYIYKRGDANNKWNLWQTISNPDPGYSTWMFKFGMWFDFVGDYLLIGVANRARLSGKCSYLYKLEGNTWKFHYATTRSLVPAGTYRGVVNMYGSPFVGISDDNYMVTAGDTSKTDGNKAIDIWKIKE